MRGYRFCGAYGLLSHMRGKHSDNPKAQTKRKELQIFHLLQTNDVPFEYQVHMPFAGCGLQDGTKCAYLDFVVPRRSCTLILEIDEGQHKVGYTTSCDLGREMNVMASVAMGSGGRVVLSLRHS